MPASAPTKTRPDAALPSPAPRARMAKRKFFVIDVSIFIRVGMLPFLPPVSDHTWE